jgi:hypothetical protein
LVVVKLLLIPLNNTIPDIIIMSKTVVTDDFCESHVFGIII